MSGRKRVWSTVSVYKSPDGFGVCLDDKPLTTPGRLPLCLPMQPLADAIAAEWAAVTDVIQPEKMHFTRLANSALEMMPGKRDAVRAMLGDYAQTDLLCYRAETPQGLAERQALAWDPVLDWLKAQHGVHLASTCGVMPIPQEASAVARMRAWLDPADDLGLMALHDMVTLCGSLALSMAVAERFLTAEAAWAASRVDALWQADQWGYDDIAETEAAQKGAAFARAAQLWEWGQA